MGGTGFPEAAGGAERPSEGRAGCRRPDAQRPGRPVSVSGWERARLVLSCSVCIFRARQLPNPPPLRSLWAGTGRVGPSVSVTWDVSR